MLSSSFTKLGRIFTKLCLIAGLLLALVFPVSTRAEFILQTDSGSLLVNPATLELFLSPKDRPAMELSAAMTNLGKVANLKNNAGNASWSLPEKKIVVTMDWSGQGLLVHILAEEAGEFTFPRIRSTASIKGWILPFFEGVYVPPGDIGWKSFLTDYGDMNTTAELGLPFIATDHGDSTVTYIFTNQFNNRIRFLSLSNELMEATLTHDFTRNHPVKEYAVLIKPGKGSPVEPAKQYRQWLIDRGEFVSLKEKIKKTPEAAKLLGAAHAYVWGEGLLAAADISDWKKFAREFMAQAESTNANPARRIFDLMQPDAKKTLTTLSTAQWADKWTISIIVDDLNRLLTKEGFYDAESWRGVALDKNISDLVPKNSTERTQAELCRLNAALLAAAFPQFVAKPETWGNGVCPKMVEALAAAGIDRLCFLTSGWSALVNRPETVTAARKAGYLVGTYDSYDSVHSPKMADSWETAQFDQKLYDTGAVLNADGSKRHGFQKKGYKLSPISARPYVEKRVTGLMKDFPANAWFMDCDGFGDFFDDYSPAHPATQQDDMQVRISRMAWIRDAFGAVIGTEGCSAGIAATVHFTHGVMTPVIGWGDPDLAGKQSHYYLGKYYPPDAPEVFFKPVPMKEKYQHIYFDPRFRLPLFETVFHDSVVATHHWSFGSLKTKDQAKTVELLELLYEVPPLYHLNLAEFKKRKTAILHHYAFFSPLHRETGLMAVADFKWLTPARDVQQTSFGNEIDVVANFGSADFQWETVSIKPGSIVAKWRKSGEMKGFSP